MKDQVVELAQFRKREKRRFIADNPFVCGICGDRFLSEKSRTKHKLEKHQVDALQSLFMGPKEK